MNESEARSKLRQLLDTHNLEHWNIKFDNARSRNGICYFKRKTIGLSRHLVETATYEDTIDTMLHEIAHAIDFEERGTSDHSWKWKRIAVRIGAKPNRCANKMVDVKNKYSYQCPKCPSVTVDAGKRLSVANRSCRRCRTQLRDFIVTQKW